MSDASREEIKLSPRPYLPPVAAAAAAAVLAALIALEAGWTRWCAQPHARGLDAIPVVELAFIVAVAMGCLLASAVLARRRSAADDAARISTGAVRVLRWAAVGATTGALASVGALVTRAEARATLRSASVSTFVIEVESDPAIGVYGERADAGVFDQMGARVASVTVSGEHLEVGQRLCAVGRFSVAEEGPWDKTAYLAGRVGEITIVRVLEALPSSISPIGDLRRVVLEAIDPEASAANALIAGVVCGRTTELNQTTAADAFSRTGTSHLVAVSGSHLALVAGLAGVALRAAQARPATRASVLAVLMAAYVIFTGGAASAVRSFGMVVGSLIAQLGARRPHGLSALALSVWILVLSDPGMVHDVGFQLSVASVLFILLFGSYLTTFFMRARLPRSVAAALALTLCAQAATMPLTLPLFNEVSLIAPFANLAAGPLMSALTVVGIAAAPVAAAVPLLAAVVLAVPRALAALSLFVVELFASVPYAALTVEGAWVAPVFATVFYGGAGAMYTRWRLPRPGAAPAALAVLIGVAAVFVGRAAFAAPPAVTVLDVGQGDAILVRDGPQAVLVDCGVDDAVARALARVGVVRLDAVVITHWDSDHWGGLADVLASVPVGELIVAEGAPDVAPSELFDLNPPPMVEVSRGATLLVGGFRCDVVWPREKLSTSENEDSLVLEVTYQTDRAQLRMLLTGDTEAEEAERYASEVGDIDVLKLGHHGSAASVSEEMLRVLDPELAIASAGEGNRYGHPAPETQELVEAYRCAFACTIDAGDIVIEPSEQGVAVTCADASAIMAGRGG